MGIGSGRHGAILKLLERYFEAEIKRLQHDWVVLPRILGIQSPRGGRWDTSRIPDISIISNEQWVQFRDREAIIRLNESVPILVVEIVSESTKSTDYRAKRAEYCVLNIAEYWIVDPLDDRMTILSLEDEWYEATEYMGSDAIQSTIFPELNLIAEQILQGQQFSF